MFNFFAMAGNYEQRKVACYPEEGDFLVDTAAVNDSEQPYETAVQHPDYNDGKMVIVEMYDTREDAQAGHERWVKTMTTEPLPDELRDVSTCGLVGLMDAFGDDGKWKRKPRNVGRE